MTANMIDYRAVLEDIESKIKKLQAAADAIREMVSITDAAPVAGSSGQNVSAGMFFNMSIADATEKYLDSVKRPKSIPEIARALEEGGFPHTSKDFTSNVRSALFREVKKPDTKIVRRDDGDYGLVSWYRGLRSKENRAKQGDVETTKNGLPTEEEIAAAVEDHEEFIKELES